MIYRTKQQKLLLKFYHKTPSSKQSKYLITIVGTTIFPKFSIFKEKMLSKREEIWYQSTSVRFVSYSLEPTASTKLPKSLNNTRLLRKS
jgi:hypothetical protein